MSGKLSEAKTEAEISLSLTEIPTEKAKSHGELARIAHADGNPDEVEAELEKMEKAAPDHPGIKHWSEQIRRELEAP